MLWNNLQGPFAGQEGKHEDDVRATAAGTNEPREHCDGRPILWTRNLDGTTGFYAGRLAVAFRC